MDAPFVVSAIMAGVPAFGIIWHSLRDYDRPRAESALFNFQKVILTLVVGFIFGAVANILRLSLPLGYFPIWIPFLVLTGMAVLEETFKTVFLNMKRFQLKFDTTFYGLSLSVGIGAAMAIYDSYVTLRPGGMISDPTTLTALVLLSFGIVALHASTGSVIGYGASKGDVFPSLLQAIAYRVFYVLLILPFILIPAIPDIRWLGLAFLVASFLYALFLYWRAYRLILPETLPEDLKRKRIREARKKRLSGNPKE
ncbi:MAG: hypothetical protein ACE5QF_07220 [Thermoplasmata archaeon]